MARTTRRKFLKASAAASTAFPLFALAGTKASGKVLGANDTIRVAVAGIHGRGGNHISEFAGRDKVQVTYLVDPDSSLFESRTRNVQDKAGNKPKCVQDIREALDDPNVDVVSIATPNHWHSLMTVWACEAGKDVYVEKPLSHNVHEGRVATEVARRTGRVVQHGTQSRSSSGTAKEIAAVQSGKYGKLLVSKGYCCKPRWSIGFEPVTQPPKHLDFDIWLGPASEQPFHRNLVHYDWHWFWDFGNGDIGNQGVHQMDIARWAIKGATLPTSVWSLGGRFLPEGPDQGQTPNMQVAVMEFGDVILLFETRGLVGKKGTGAPNPIVANEFYTTEGVIKGGRFYPNGSDQGESLQAEGNVAPGGAFGSFIAAVRSRRPEDNNADVEVGHYSSALCHLPNISHRLGESATFDKRAKSLGDNKQVVESWENLVDNLKAVNVRLDGATYQVGRHLKFDPKSEKFVGDNEANALLTREYRKGYELTKTA